MGLFASAKLEKARYPDPASRPQALDLWTFFVIFSGGLVHVVELKILKGKDISLDQPSSPPYMKHKRRKEGWLVFFDARQPN